MSYSEFVSELKLENRVIAVTRVNSADEKQTIYSAAFTRH